MRESRDSQRLFVVGANSLVGQLMRSVWNGRPVTWCARSGAVDAIWDLHDGAEALARQLAGHHAVLCLAGATPGAQDFTVNVKIGETVVAAASSAGVPQVLLASTMAVYGAEPGPVPETAACTPLAAYGHSKLEMERACLGAPGVTALRLGNVVGADMLFRNMAAGRGIVIDQFPDGRTPRRSYIDPSHLARVIDRLVGQTLPPILNVAAAPAAHMGALATAADIAWQARPAPNTALPVAEMDLTRLSQYVEVATEASAMVAGWRRAVRAMA